MPTKHLEEPRSHLNMNIHPTAIVSDQAQIGRNVTIGPYCIINENVIIKDNCNITSHIVIHSYTTLEENVEVESFASLGGNPQDLSFDPESITHLTIGKNTQIKEGVTISRATKPGKHTRIGDNCMLMAYSHVGHDCLVGDHVVLVNNVLLAGHVQIEDHVVVGGGAAVHQFLTIGEGAMISGAAELNMDVPPYTIASKRNTLSGINIKGLKRRSFTREAILELKNYFKNIYSPEIGRFEDKAKKILGDSSLTLTPSTRYFLEFFTQDHRKGVSRPKIK